MREAIFNNVFKPFDFYPFGMIMPGRAYTSTSTYKFGYQGSLKDDDITLAGGTYSTFFRELDTRLPRWYTIDPESKAWESPYVAMGDNPIWHNDVKGNTVNDDFKLSKGGGVSLIRRTNDKSHSFYNEDGKFLFSISATPSPRKDYEQLPKDFKLEVTWSITKVALQVFNRPDLKKYMLDRGAEEGWDAKPGVDALNGLGRRNQNLLFGDAALGWSKLWPSQSTREGKPSSPIGLVSNSVDNIDRIYPSVMNGRDLTYDISHPKDVVNDSKYIDGRSFLQVISDVFTQGINQLSNWSSTPPPPAK